MNRKIKYKLWSIFILSILLLMSLSVTKTVAKYTEDKEIGSLVLDITDEPSYLNRQLKNYINKNASTYIFDSYNNQKSNVPAWNNLENMGGTLDGTDNTELNNSVKYYYDSNNDTVYVLSKGSKPLMFPANCKELFYGVFTTSATNIQFNNIDTSHVTTMFGMFEWTSAPYLDLSHFNVSNVTQFNYMFHMSANLKTVVFGENWQQSTNLKDMQYMFNGCTNLESIDFNHINTSQVVNMNCLFNGCRKLKNIDLSSLDMSETLYSQFMFMNYGKDITEPISFTFSKNAPKLEVSNGMFQGANFETIDLSGFYAPRIQFVEGMFKDCTNVKELNLSSFDTANVSSENMKDFFTGCTQLEKVTLGANFKFLDTTAVLPTTSDGKWYINQEEAYTPEELVSVQNNATSTMTYYANKDQSPIVNTLSFDPEDEEELNIIEVPTENVDESIIEEPVIDDEPVQNFEGE
ncbi:BspA family leucine-rich repeat surface protein [Floccifex sp.]|uniref:BspA family leucine-rich repeat surface protein n=1 Tax=Floccifex sp. TaxID=2815810 RepID=UPI003F116E1F